MPYLAAFAPPHWTVLHIDEVARPVDFGCKRTCGDYLSYPKCASRLRHGRPVPAAGNSGRIGGPHVTLLPDEAQAHADVIFVGEANLTGRNSCATLTRGGTATVLFH